MLHVHVITSPSFSQLATALRADGHKVTECRSEQLSNQTDAFEPDIILADLRRSQDYHEWFVPARENYLPPKAAFILLVSPETLTLIGHDDFEGDFVVEVADSRPTREIMVRIQRIARKLAPHKVAQRISIDGLTIDAEGYEVKVDGDLIELTYQEFLLLTFLSSKRGRVFTREQLLDQVWGYNYFGGTRTVDIHVRRIRAKLAPKYDRYIQTVRQVGYKFVVEAPS